MVNQLLSWFSSGARFKENLINLSESSVYLYVNKQIQQQLW